MLKPDTGPPFYACVTLPCSTRYTLSNCFMNAPDTSWVMATTMQGRASRFSMTCPLVSGSRLAVISSAMFEITGYCSCELCTGENHFTKSGTAPRPDYTVAADPDVFPLGSRIRIGEIIYLVEDTGASIKGNVVDIYYETHEEAVANGRYEAEVFLIRGM